jgi:4-amino-4-deoxychorismate lyase
LRGDAQKRAAAPPDVWVDGSPGHSVDALDRGLQYGDGVFETMRVRGGAIRLLELHLDRLLEGCRRLAIRGPARAALRRELMERARPHADAVLKLIVTRGAGARGYRPDGSERPTRVVVVSPRPPDSPQVPQRVRICAMPLGSNAALAGLKTLNRLESVLARSEWRDERVWEGLMRDADGWLVSGTMSNLFVRRGSVLMTPRLDRCGIAGVMRRWVLDQARGLGWRARETRIALEQLRTAEEVFMTNAVAGIVSVRQIEHGRRRLRIRSSDSAAVLRARLAELP